MSDKQCMYCGYSHVDNIDGGWIGETKRPYTIYRCYVCDRLWCEYDEIKVNTYIDFVEGLNH